MSTKFIHLSVIWSRWWAVLLAGWSLVSVEWRLSLSVGDNNLSPVTWRGEGESLSAGPSLPSLPNPRIYPWSPLSGPRTMAMAGLVSVLESWPCVSHITQWHCTAFTWHFVTHHDIVYAYSYDQTYLHVVVNILTIQQKSLHSVVCTLGQRDLT